MNLLKNLTKSSIASLNYIRWKFSHKPANLSKNQNSVLIVNNGFIGDLLATTPLIDHLAGCGLDVDLMIRPDMKDIFKNNVSVRKIFYITEFNEKKINKEFGAIFVISCDDLSLIRELSKKTGLLAGYISRKVLCSHDFYNEVIFEPREKINKVLSIFKFAQFIGGDVKEKTPLSTPLNLKPDRHYTSIEKPLGDFAIISPASRSQLLMGIKMVDAEKWGAAADYLIEKYGLGIYLVGTEKEKSMCEKIYALAKNKKNIHNVSGVTSLQDLFLLIKSAKLVVGIDSGTMHVAASQGTPIVELMRKNQFKIWRPWADDRKLILFKTKNNDLNTISLDKIKSAIRSLLDK